MDWESTSEADADGSDVIRCSKNQAQKYQDHLYFHFTAIKSQQTLMLSVHVYFSLKN